MTYREYIRIELEEIRRHKWIESEKAGRDLGQKAVLDWIERYAREFHERMMPAPCCAPESPAARAGYPAPSRA